MHEEDGGPKSEGNSESVDQGERFLVDTKRGYEELRPEDILADEAKPYEPGEEYDQVKPEEMATVPPLLEIFKRRPPADPDKMHLLRLPIMVGIDPRPFDPSTYVEEDIFATDKFGHRRHIPFKNIIRWRAVKNPDGTTSVESNAHFVMWEDDSLQLYIGNKSFDVFEQDVQDIQTHLFLKTEEGIFQSQGRILKRMQLMPSSSTSDVGARHNKVNKVKNFIADIDPEWEMPEREMRYKEKGLKCPHELATPTARPSQRPVASSESNKDSKYKSRREEHEGSSSQRRSKAKLQRSA